MSDRIELLIKSLTELSKHLPFTFSLCFMYRLLKNAWHKRINLQNMQAAHAPQYQKNKQPNRKMGRRPK